MKLPRGTHIKPEKVENFHEIMNELRGDFQGAMRMRGSIDDKIFFVDFIIKDGAVIAASFKRQFDGYTTQKEEAIYDIQKRLAGSAGDLDLFSYTPDEMARAIEGNSGFILEEELMVYDLGLKLKSKISKKKADHDYLGKILASRGGGRKLDRMEELRGAEGGIRSRSEKEYATRVRETQQSKDDDEDLQRKEERKKQLGRGESLGGTEDIPEAGQDDEKKQAEQGKAKREIAEPSGKKLGIPRKGQLRKESKLREIDERRAKRFHTLEKQVEIKKKAALDAPKIETNIDKLLNIVREEKKIKINDSLANKLHVNKTQVEEWAMILEEHNLVDLHYPALGEPEIRKIKKVS